MTYIATFFSHFGAIRFKKFCDSRAWSSQIMPVPRDLSSSCGTCVRYEGDLTGMEKEGDPGYGFWETFEELEQIAACTDHGYEVRYRIINS